MRNIWNELSKRHTYKLNGALIYFASLLPTARHGLLIVFSGLFCALGYNWLCNSIIYWYLIWSNWSKMWCTRLFHEMIRWFQRVGLYEFFWIYLNFSMIWIDTLCNFKWFFIDWFSVMILYVTGFLCVKLFISN